MPRFQRVPPRRPVPWHRTLRLWAGFVAAAVAVFLLVMWSERLPDPRPASAPATEFSAARAWPALAYLADTLGHRVPGSPAHDEARAYLLRQLRALPGVEVTEQDALGATGGTRGVFAYRTRNVLARVPGRRPDAVLLSAHYDSPAESVGAADDGIAVAAMLEVARALTAGPTLEHSVILHFNDAEEQGLLGVTNFVRHLWLRDVRAFVNLESAGNMGKAILFQAGPENSWLTRRYARHAAHPYGSVIGQDIFQSGLIPSGTDFAIYTGNGGVRGLDVAFYRGGYAYHTALDRVAAVAPGSVQHMGDNALAVVRGLAAGPLPGDVGGTPSVYYDLLGVTMLAYDRTVAAVLAAAALLLLVWALQRVTARGLAPGREIATAALFAALGVVLALLLAVAGSAIGPWLLGRAHGWFAHPGRAVAAYGGLTLTGLLLAQWLYTRRRRARDLSPAERVVAAWAGALVLLGLVLLALTLLGIGSAYLLLWWVLGGATGLLLLTRGREPRWAPALVVALLPGLLLTAQVTYLLVALFAPIAGRFGNAIPFDVLLAGIMGVSLVVLLLVPVTVLHFGERVGVVATLALAVSVVGLATVWLSFPYTASRPQRVAVVHEDDGRQPRLALTTMDWPGPTQVAAALAQTAGGAASGGADGELWFPAPSIAEPPAAVTLVGERATAGGGRELDLRVQGFGAYELTLRTPPERPARWRVAGVPEPTPTPVPRLMLLAGPDSGWLVTMTVPGSEPVILSVATRRHRPSAAAQALMDRLPRWATAYGETLVRRDLVF